MFAHVHGHQSDRRVHVVRSGDRHRVDVPAFLLQHHAEILEVLRLRIFLERTRRVDLVHVAKRVDVFIIHIGNVAGAFAADADAGNVQAAIRAEHVSAGNERNGQRGGRDDGAFDELPAGKATGLHNGYRIGCLHLLLKPRRGQVSRSTTRSARCIRSCW